MWSAKEEKNAEMYLHYYINIRQSYDREMYKDLFANAEHSLWNIDLNIAVPSSLQWVIM